MAHLGQIVFYRDADDVRPAIVVATRSAEDVDLVVFVPNGPPYNRSAVIGERDGNVQENAQGFDVAKANEKADQAAVEQAAQDERNQPESPSPAPAEGVMGPISEGPQAPEDQPELTPEDEAVANADVEPAANAGEVHDNPGEVPVEPPVSEGGDPSVDSDADADAGDYESRIDALEDEEAREDREGTV